MPSRNSILLLLLFAAGMPVGEPLLADSIRSRPVRRPSGWVAPQCEVVRGIPSVSFTTDGGRSVPQHEEKLEGLQLYTFGLAALKTPNRLLAVTSRLLATSRDGGCEWLIDGRFTFPQHDYRLLPRTGGGVWAWSPLAPELFVLDEEGTVVRQAAAPVLLPLAFSEERGSPGSLATGDDAGRIWWSDDAGVSWTMRASSPARTPLYTMEFSPRGRTHVITSGLADGSHVSFDGGLSWVHSAGLEGLNVFRVAFSPVAPDVVWALALDPKATGPWRRAIHHSSDGGRSFRRVVAESAELDMPSGFVLAPAPADPALLYFPLPGTTLHLVDDEGRIRSSSPLPYRDVTAIAFAPGAPHLIYLGLKLSDMSAQQDAPAE